MNYCWSCFGSGENCEVCKGSGIPRQIDLVALELYEISCGTTDKFEEYAKDIIEVLERFKS